MLKRKFIIALLILLISLIVFFLFRGNNPYENVEWVKGYPGSTDRYVTYTPVIKKEPSIVLGPTVGADYADIRFEDVDGDGIKEVIIETSVLIDFGETYTPERHILKSYVDNKGMTRFELLSSEKLRN